LRFSRLRFAVIAICHDADAGYRRGRSPSTRGSAAAGAAMQQGRRVLRLLRLDLREPGELPPLLDFPRDEL